MNAIGVRRRLKAIAKSDGDFEVEVAFTESIVKVI